MPAALAVLLSGCSSLPSSLSPVSWWHDLQGGKIAEDRPPPPGADQPYPNLATVPPKPAAPDRAAMKVISDRLIADRANAQRMAELVPLADPSSPNASPGLFGKGTAPPPPPPPPPAPPSEAPTASATMPAASAPPAPPAPAAPAAVPAPAKAPVGDVQSTPLAPPGAAAQPPAEAAAPPPIPTTPPPPPNLSRTPPVPAAPPPPPVPAAQEAPVAAAPAPAAMPPSPPPVAAAPPQPAPPAPPPAPAVVATATPAPTAAAPASLVSVGFANGSADLPSTAAATLKELAARRGKGIIAVTGYGEATSNDPNAQSAALTLGLSRAQAMAGALTAAGVPASFVRVDAEAIGRGGTARLIQ